MSDFDQHNLFLQRAICHFGCYNMFATYFPDFRGDPLNSTFYVLLYFWFLSTTLTSQLSLPPTWRYTIRLAHQIFSRPMSVRSSLEDKYETSCFQLRRKSKLPLRNQMLFYSTSIHGVYLLVIKLYPARCRAVFCCWIIRSSMYTQMLDRH